MPRKPTRFWHPARRFLTRARDAAHVRANRGSAATSIDEVRARLQHYLRAIYGNGVVIESLPPAPRSGLTMRMLRRIALVQERAMSESSAESIRLPTTLPSQRTDVPAVEQFRLIAVQHAERLRRQSARHEGAATTDLERDLFQLAEAAVIDAEIVASQPGLRSALTAARAESIARRPRPRWRTEIELHVEALFRRTWSPAESASADGITASLDPLLPDNDAEANATWARRTAAALEAKYGRKAASTYRRVPEITLWQTSIRTPVPEEQALAVETEMRQQERALPADERQSSSRSAMPGPSQSSASQNNQGGTSGSTKKDQASSQSESPGTDGHGEDGAPTTERSPEVDTESESDGDSAGVTSPDGTGDGDTQSGAGHSADVVGDAMLGDARTFRYPEWDFNARGYTPAGAIVRIVPSPPGSIEWAATALSTHAREVHRARAQFERLRSHRLRLRRQLQGDDLDLEACVEAMVNRRMNVAPSDRLYSLMRPGRRELAITLLIDVSGSTSAVVEGDQRVIDIERIAALVAASAFDALGDDYSILAFSSASASNVRVHALKEFGEANSPLVRQRIAALAPHGHTRLGAAVRHAAAQLATHPAPHRLLLILSDGKPHDYDLYFVDYAIQDSRRAIIDARLQGIHPFCITVDAREGEEYLADIFGSAGYRVVARPAQVPNALLQAVRRMIGGGY